MTAPVPSGRPLSEALRRNWVNTLRGLCPSAREAMLRGLEMSYGQRAACLVRAGLR